MRIDGEWYECDDEVVRPIIRGEVFSAHGSWEPVLFLVDTGADCTVFSAAILDVLGFEPGTARGRLGGIGGVAESVDVATRIRLAREDGGNAVFRGRYSAFTQLESLDMSVLGRDIMQMFAVIVDRPDDVVSLVGQQHRYVIQSR
jgi:hypothetical protein